MHHIANAGKIWKREEKSYLGPFLNEKQAEK